MTSVHRLCAFRFFSPDLDCPHSSSRETTSTSVLFVSSPPTPTAHTAAAAAERPPLLQCFSFLLPRPRLPTQQLQQQRDHLYFSAFRFFSPDLDCLHSSCRERPPLTSVLFVSSPPTSTAHTAAAAAAAAAAAEILPAAFELTLASYAEARARPPLGLCLPHSRPRSHVALV